MAVDDKNVYAGIADFKVPKAAILGSTLADLLEIHPEQVAGATPGIYAINLKTGAVAWSVRPQNGDYDAIYSAAVTVTNDVLFAGSLDGTIRAFDLRAGKEGSELWSYYTAVNTTDIQGREGNGGAIDSVGPVIAGNQLLLNTGYSVFNIGGKNPWQGGPGNAIFVFE
ncbi:MAG: PQQ-binding-like beta-propeller repeat protein [Pseudomonadales bacterium]|nr:PQQ-binding-like beta-propeller repeat protein [Pseudomonadales bacterium]